MVPNGWKEVKLGDVITHQKGFAFKSEHYCDEGSRIIRISDTDRNSIHDKAPVYIRADNSVGLERYKLSKGDIILSTVGSRPHLTDSMVGKAVQIPRKDDGALLNQNLVKISPKKKLITNNFLFSMLKKSQFNFFISTLVRGNANQVSITLNELFAYGFLLPSHEEQRKIAKILSTWDKAIATTEKLIATSKQQKKALMQQLLTGKKRLCSSPKDGAKTGIAFEGEWEEVRLDDLATYRRGSFPQPYGNPEWVDEINGYPFIQVFDIDKNMKLKSKTKTKISNAAIGKSVFIKTGTLIVSLQGSIGRVAITQYDAYVDRTILLFQGFKYQLDTVYFAYSIQELFDIEKEKAPGGTIKTITKQVLSNFTIQVPTFEEQQKIASVLTAADKEIELLQTKLSHFKQEKKALMQQLLTGKRRVKVDQDQTHQ